MKYCLKVLRHDRECYAVCRLKDDHGGECDLTGGGKFGLEWSEKGYGLTQVRLRPAQERYSPGRKRKVE
jgi:hypothetical protein